MTKLLYFSLAAASAFIFTSCAGSLPAPTKDALVMLEKGAYEAWKSKDAKFWDTFLSDKFVGYDLSGKLDKKSAISGINGTDCEIKSYALSDGQMQVLASDVALLTYRATVDGKCGGQKVPAISWAASVFLREGDAWKEVFHAEAPVIDPKAAVADVVVKGKDSPAMGDAGTDEMLAVEKVVWEAWKDHDGGKISELTAKEISFINIFGSYFESKAEALKDWSGAGCEVKSVSVTNAAGTMIAPTVGILTFRGSADGTCFGQKVGPIWGSSIYVKDGDVWKWAFGINLPARS